MLNGLDLFSGIGGISLALSPWVRTVCYVEIDRYCQGVLMSRMRSGDLDHAPIWDDIKTFESGLWIGQVDIVTGGFPCQDISLAGNGAGLGGERSGLFFEIVRLAREIRPRFIFLENVPAIVGRGGREVAGALAALGYDARWGVLSAYDVGAPHLRERWWCLGRNTKSNGSDKVGSFPSGPDSITRRIGEDVAHATGQPQREPANQTHPIATGRKTRDEPFDSGEYVDNTLRGRYGIPGKKIRARRNSSFDADWWAVEPDVGRVAHGVPHRVDRIKGLGNSVVPVCVREAFLRLIGQGV